MNTVSVRLSLAQEIIDLLRSYLNVADDDIQKSLIQAAIDQLKATDPDNLSVEAAIVAARPSKRGGQMPLIWKNGEQVEGTTAEFVSQLRAVADRANERFSLYSDERGLLGDFIRRAADEIEFHYHVPVKSG